MKVNTYKTIILPIALHGYETWSLTLREEHRLRCSRITYLEIYFGLKKKKLRETGESDNAELHALYSLPNIIRNPKSRRLGLTGLIARTDSPEMHTEI